MAHHSLKAKKAVIIQEGIKIPRARLPPGKIAIDVMKETIFKNLGAKRNEIVVGPSVGIDGAVIDIGDKSLVVSIDPVTGSLELNVG